jgi:hypothetical protein
MKTIKDIQGNGCKYHNGDLCPLCLQQEALKLLKKQRKRKLCLETEEWAEFLDLKDKE